MVTNISSGLIRQTNSAVETRALAAEWLAALPPDKAVALALSGDLGSGKTCFVQGLAAAMGIREAVTSPTFTIVNEYQGLERKLFHADWYRLGDAYEVETLGLEDALATDAVIAIEWPNKAPAWLPTDTIFIDFRNGLNPSERLITMR